MIFDALLRWQRFLEVSGTANARTRREYRRYLLAFVADVMADPEWPSARDVLALTEDDIVEYLARYTAAKGPSRGMLLRALRSFYGWASSRDLIASSPVGRMKPGRSRYGPAPSLSVEQADALLRAAGEMRDPRAAPAIALQLYTGCRVGSLIAAEPADVDLGPLPSIVFRVAKGDRPYRVPLGPRGTDAARRLVELKDWHPVTAKRRPTLVGVGEERYRDWLREAASRAGVGHVWTHLLRHTAATRVAESGADIRTVMELFNWEDPRLIRRYAAASDERMRQAVARF